MMANFSIAVIPMTPRRGCPQFGCSSFPFLEAEPLYQRALEVLGPDHPSTASSLNIWRAPATREKVLEPDYPDAASSLNNMAMLYNNQSMYDEAEPLYQRALATREVLGPDGIILINFIFLSFFLVLSFAVKESACLVYSVTITFVIKEVFQAHPWPCLLVD